MLNALAIHSQIPVLETERLLLRAHRLEDFAHCAAMWSDAAVTAHIGGEPLSEEDCWARFLRYVGHWSLLGFGFWLAEEKETSKFAGEMGFADYKRGLPALKGTPEIGWALASHAHGKGYATEAVRAVIAWGDEHLPSPRTACIIAPENLASIRVATKCGYRESERTTYKGNPTLVFSREANREGISHLGN